MAKKRSQPKINSPVDLGDRPGDLLRSPDQLAQLSLFRDLQKRDFIE